jgi:long-chain fatty acid transport protein
MNRFFAFVLTALAALPFLTPPARASSALEMLGSPTGGNALTARLFSHNAGAAYFNPALLPVATFKLEAGFFGLVTRGKIRLKARPAGSDVPTAVYDSELSFAGPRPIATQDLANPRSNTDENDHVLYAVVGLVRPLAGKYLVFGFYSLLPINSFLDEKGFFADEREQYFTNKLYFEQLGDRASASSFAFSLGSQLNDWLSIGAGIDIAVVTQSNTAVYVPDAAKQSNVLLNPDIHTNSKFKPYLGVVYRPSPRVNIAATLHLGTSNDTTGQNQVRIRNDTSQYGPDVNYIPQTYVLTQGNEPARVGLGASLASRRLVESGRPAWEVGLVLVGERWSQYRDRHGESPLDAWHNTVSLVAGGNFAWRQRRLSFDLGYVPSPVPDQTGRTNYVDNSRIVSSASIESPVNLLGREIEAGFYLFGSVFVPRSVDKDLNRTDANALVDEFPDSTVNNLTHLPDPRAAGLQTNNPGYPGFDSHGYMLGAGFSLRIAR